MKKIPTLFERVFDNGNIIECTRKVTPGMEWVLEGLGLATVKYDGSCCAIINGEFYKRYDAKKGKSAPNGAIKCQETPDPVTGHFPCWVKCNRNNNSDKWFWDAYDNSDGDKLPDGTYEAIGTHFQRNPYSLHNNTLIKHGIYVINIERTYDGIKQFLSENYIEGIVFWKDGEPKCKIKRRDFGFDWNRLIFTSEINGNCIVRPEINASCIVASEEVSIKKLKQLLNSSDIQVDS